MKRLLEKTAYALTIGGLVKIGETYENTNFLGC